MKTNASLFEERGDAWNTPVSRVRAPRIICRRTDPDGFETRFIADDPDDWGGPVPLPPRVPDPRPGSGPDPRARILANKLRRYHRGKA